MQRTFIGDLGKKIGEKVLINGWVSVRRDQGKMVFVDVRDMSGTVQGVVLPLSAAIGAAKEVTVESAVALEGVVNKRPEKNVVQRQNGDIELQIESIEIMSKAQVAPFDIATELHLDTYLDHLPLMLHTERTRNIFKMQSTILGAYRSSLRNQGFTEFMAPALVGADAEGGGAVFKLDYYNEYKAYLAVSPQFYKQIMVGAFERSCTIAKVFRAEKSATTRHLSEITQMDFEMGFIENEREPMRVLEQTIRDTVREVVGAHQDIFDYFKTATPLIPAEIPILTLQEAQQILGVPEESDLAPEDERNICGWAKEHKQSDFVFITRFPTAKRAFYTYEDPSEAPLSRGFDLLFRGLEINSGAQRIHDHDMLVARIKERGMDPQKYAYYLQAFKYGMPPHGGSSTGLERFTARMLEIQNVKEATAFPRDMTRIDSRLAEENDAA
ncbi:aspartate--tRNA(Asn) ligase [Candidatus Kaiserbacteria bacterium]|nr:aspartate--tRNA(Asn) ligase [Candidatus Kaiserbacteria bacterium]